MILKTMIYLQPRESSIEVEDSKESKVRKLSEDN